ncbi:MAG: hypothetical protein N2235_01520 [Fischerella sp.]|nr:hypothetical protein [Fischerella sp.]
MRLHDLIREDTGNYSALMTVLSYLRSRAEKIGQGQKIKTLTLINMVKNAGDSAFNYGSLVNANKKNPAIKNLIKSFNQDEVILTGNSDSSVDLEKINAPTDTVGKMAKQALSKRM